jgi:hypothetical protein
VAAGQLWRAEMGIAEAFAEAYALGSSLASLVCVTGLVLVPRVRTRYLAWRCSRQIGRFLAELA